jgi:hypothetical protein
MGIFDNLFKKHGHKDDETIKELLNEIKIQEENERRLIKENERIFKELQRCLHPGKPHPVRFDVVFS